MKFSDVEIIVYKFVLYELFLYILLLIMVCWIQLYLELVQWLVQIVEKIF